MKNQWKGILLCLAVAIPCQFLGKKFPMIGGPVFAILGGMILTSLWREKGEFADGIKWVSKKLLQLAVVLLGFGLNLSAVLKTGLESLPVILTTIAVSLLTAYLLHKTSRTPANLSTLIGVGSSVCGGSAIAATAPVIDADDEEVAQAISVIFFFNVLAAFLFPWIGTVLGFPTESGEAFGIFAGTAVNDTSSVTAVASTWDMMHGLGSSTLDKAVTVKLTRTLAIVPITLGLAFFRAKRSTDKKEGGVKRVFPTFILYFIVASVITTVAQSLGVSNAIFAPIKTLSKFFIVLAMSAVGLNTDLVKLVKSGAKPLFLGFSCWAMITVSTLALQSLLGLR